MKICENGTYRDMTEEEIAEYNTMNDLEVTPSIEELKQELSNSDYKIIKCMEDSLIGANLPYNIEELHAERQSIRDKINELETI